MTADGAIEQAVVIVGWTMAVLLRCMADTGTLISRYVRHSRSIDVVLAC